MKITNRVLPKTISLCAALAACLFAGLASAQQFPSKPITIVTPGGPGGPPDLLARSLAPKLEKELGQPVIVENKPGAGGYLSAEQTARVTDGHTLLINAFGGMHLELFMKGQQLLLTRDLIPVAPVADAPQYLITTTALPVKDLKEFVAYVKANPGKLNDAVFPSSAPHLATILFLKTAGLNMVEIPYNSAAGAITAILRNEAHLYLAVASGIKPHVDEGKITPLAVAAEQRTDMFPNVQTTREFGYDFQSSSYFVLFASAATPAPIVNRLNAAITAAVSSEDLWANWGKIGYVRSVATPAQLKEKLLAENRRYHEVAEAAGIKPE